MTSEPVRASSAWLRLREPADAAARAAELVEQVRAKLPHGSTVTVHDLGCGSGSMARWLAPRLPGPQRWLVYDRDQDLLVAAAADPPAAASDGAPVHVETRHADITGIEPGALAGADLITASALLDMLTAPELERLVAVVATARCPVLICLSVTGRVELTPPDPLDGVVMDAFNQHQQRLTRAGRLLGPRALSVAGAAFSRRGFGVTLRPSPWRLGPDELELISEWLSGWVHAACEQRPELRGAAGSYARRRLASVVAGHLAVVVEHEDLLALPS